MASPATGREKAPTAGQMLSRGAFAAPAHTLQIWMPMGATVDFAVLAAFSEEVRMMAFVLLQASAGGKVVASK